MNELRQTKDTHYVNPTFQGGDFIKPTNKPAKTTREVMLEDQGGKYTVPSKGADPVPVTNPFEHEEVDKTVDQIVEDLQPQIFDAIFQMINDEMAKRYVFDSSEYLTESGLELFEDEWFEFYHENHGKIMHKLLQNLK
jgi:hypothetical protein